MSSCVGNPGRPPYVSTIEKKVPCCDYPAKLGDSVGESRDHKGMKELLAEHCGHHLPQLRPLLDTTGHFVAALGRDDGIGLGLVQEVQLLLAFLDLVNLGGDVVVGSPVCGLLKRLD